MANDEPDTTRPVSTRRDFLRNSAVAGGAAWAAPTVLSLGPSAFATTNGSERCYRFRYEVSNPDKNLAGRFECDAVPNWFKCRPIADWATATCVTITNFDNQIPLKQGEARIPEGAIDVTEINNGQSVSITLPAGCEYTSLRAKAGSNDPCSEFTAPGSTANSFTVSMGPGGKEVSHVDVVFCCG